MIKLYHERARNERTAIDQSAYMVDNDGFVAIPETDDGKRHARILVQYSGFSVAKPEPKPDGETPLVSAEEVRAAVDRGARFEPITEPEPELESEPESKPSEVSTDMTRAELREMAGDIGLENFGAMSKVQLVKAILEATAGQGEGQ